MTQQIIYGNHFTKTPASNPPTTGVESWDPPWMVAVKANANFTELYGLAGSGAAMLATIGTVPPANGGLGAVNLTGIVKANGSGAATAAVSADLLTVIGTVPPANGGLGAVSLSGILKGNGASAATAASSTDILSVINLVPSANGGLGVASLSGILFGNGASAATSATQTQVGAVINPRTSAEVSAGVTPSNFAYAPGDVRRYGAVGNGSTNDRAALMAAASVSPRTYLPLMGASTTYNLGTTTAGQLTGTILDVEPGVTLSFANNSPWSLYAGAIFLRPTQVHMQDINDTWTINPTQPTGTGTLADAFGRQRLFTGDMLPVRHMTDLDFTASYTKALTVAPGSDTFATPTGITTTSNTFTGASQTANQWSGAFFDLGLHESIEALFLTLTAGQQFGVMIRGSAGWAVYYGVFGITGALLFRYVKPAGGSATGPIQDVNFPGRGSYVTFEPQNSSWSVTRTGSDTYTVQLNGKTITTPIGASIGDITQIGFVVMSSSSFGYELSDAVIYYSTEPYGQQEIQEIRVFGDSTAADAAGNWTRYLQDYLDGSYGIRVQTVTDFAVIGADSTAVLSQISTNGYGNSYYVVVVCGTNDIQNLNNISTCVTNWTSIVTGITGAGRVPVWVIPWTWYTQAETGGNGQASLNAAAGAPYRTHLREVCAQASIPFVDLTRELPYPDPAYLGVQPATLVRDNIHPDQLGFQLYARAIARSIAADYFKRPTSMWSILTADYIQSATVSMAAGLPLRMYSDGKGRYGIYGQLVVSSVPTDGTALFRVPRWANPDFAIQEQQLVQDSTNAVLTPCVLTISTAGAATISKCPSTAHVITVKLTWDVRNG